MSVRKVRGHDNLYDIDDTAGSGADPEPQSPPRFPIKRGLKTRWITTGRMDVRPGGSVTYFVSYQERLGFGD